MRELVLEIQAREDEPPIVTAGGGIIMITPPISDTYWKYRVQVSEAGQAIIGFPKFSTVGIGFAIENDWNTNLPYTSGANKIFQHIKHNKGDHVIKDSDCLTAIQMIINQATADRDAQEDQA